MYMGIIYVPKYQYLKNMVLKEMHNVPYDGYLDHQKKNCSCKEPIFLARHEERGG